MTFFHHSILHAPRVQSQLNAEDVGLVVPDRRRPVHLLFLLRELSAETTEILVALRHEVGLQTRGVVERLRPYNISPTDSPPRRIPT